MSFCLMKVIVIFNLAFDFMVVGQFEFRKIVKALNLWYLVIMEKKKRILKPDINEIAFRVVQESTNEDNLCESKSDKSKPSNKSKTSSK